MSLSQPPEKPARSRWPHPFAKADSAHRRGGAPRSPAKKWRRSPLDGAAVKACYLLLLARLPESEEVYADNRGRPRSELLGAMLQSAEFRDNVLRPLLAREAIPQERLDFRDVAFARSWLEASGVAVARGADWLEAVAAFLAEEPGRGLVEAHLPDAAAPLVEILSALRGARTPVDGRAVKALHLLLLGRLPDSEEEYARHRGRPRLEVIAELLLSGEFRDRVLLPFLADGALHQRRLGGEEFAFAQEWTGDAGFAMARPDADWSEALATLLTQPPVALAVARSLPEYAAAIDRRTSELLRWSAFLGARLDDSAVTALYLLLLARPPEGEAVFRHRRDQKRGDLIADLLASAECLHRVLLPFSLGSALPHHALENSDCELVRIWLEQAGVAAASASGDWERLLGTLVRTEPVVALLQRTQPDHAAGVQRRAASELAGLGGPAGLSRAAIAALEARLSKIEKGWQQHAPAFLNAVSSVGAFAHEQARLARELEELRRDLRAAREAADSGR